MSPKNLSNNKTLICTRNPFDVHDSWWSFHARVPENGTEIYEAQLERDEFIKMVRENEHVYGPWVEWHNSWAQEVSTNKNVYVYHYEDLVSNPEDTILKIAEFLEISVSQEHMGKILKIIKLDTMKGIENAGKDDDSAKVRNGKIGASLKNLSKLTIENLKSDLYRVDPVFGHVEIAKKYLKDLDF